MDKKPLVSISCITYNHEPFIKECLDGFLMQKTSFEFEILINDDASTDKTIEVIRQYQHLYPAIIKPIFQTENQYSRGQRGMNIKFNFPRARGNYIALCEGDDYWTDPYKLQKQVDFLENNPQYAASFHDVDMLFDDKQLAFSKHHNNPIKETMFFSDVVSNDWLIPTCSFIFKKDKLHFPPFYGTLNHGDFPLFCGILLNSKAHYFKETMGVYRRNNTSSMMNTPKAFGYLNVGLDFVQFLTWLNNFANQEDKGVIENRIYRELNQARNHINVYKNSKIFRFYSFIRGKW